jgi:hypothetical protein
MIEASYKTSKFLDVILHHFKLIKMKILNYYQRDLGLNFGESKVVHHKGFKLQRGLTFDL